MKPYCLFAASKKGYYQSKAFRTTLERSVSNYCGICQFYSKQVLENLVMLLHLRRLWCTGLVSVSDCFFV